MRGNVSYFSSKIQSYCSYAPEQLCTWFLEIPLVYGPYNNRQVVDKKQQLCM